MTRSTAEGKVCSVLWHPTHFGRPRRLKVWHPETLRVGWNRSSCVPVLIPYGKEPDCAPPNGELIHVEREAQLMEHEDELSKALPSA